MKKLEGKIALVSASTNGIGLASALKLAENGARVYLGARNEEKAQGIINAHPELDLHFTYFNANNTETFRSFVEDVLEKENKIDVLVNNYGTTDVKVDLDIANTSPEDFLRIVNSNLSALYIPVHTVLPSMIKNGGGNIINIGSVGGLYPDIQRTAYGVSKSSVNFLTKEIAVQYARNGIRCNAVLPAYTETDAAKNNMSKEFLDAFLSTVPLNRAGIPNDLANAVLFFASEDSSYITGEILPVGGGFGLPSPMYPLYLMTGAKG